ncbi:MAG: methionine adenosyltransferase domain-containing protein [Clostridia bacterium]|nr:methionine adenosyltransferase domain-containing protein [Clostridia bacterium]
MRLFSTEQVSKYHPDKYADQISDSILDACLFQDKNSRVACECMVKGKTVYLCGEITTSANIDYAKAARRVAAKLGYEIETVVQQISTQSPEIAGGILNGGAGDQGMMYGYACNETESMLPFGFDLANRIIAAIEDDVATPESLLLGDAKCQVTVDLDKEPNVDSVEKVLVSVCHKSEASRDEIRRLVGAILYGCGAIGKNTEIYVNPAGAWTLGGPAADCGLTGRKIVCDQYGGYCGVGGGAFSGKDPGKSTRMFEK